MIPRSIPSNSVSDSCERHIIIGDVHGCLSELLKLLEKCRFDYLMDRIVFVGDLIAKGPESIAVLDFAHSSNSISVVGNHEVKVLQFIKFLCSQSEKFNLSEDSEHARIASSLLHPKHARHLDYIQKLPSWFFVNSSNVLVVHAGLLPNSRPEDNDLDALTKMRSVVFEQGVMKPSAASGTESWAALWSGPETVVFGHDAARGLQVSNSVYLACS
jgi:hypothetical protein